MRQVFGVCNGFQVPDVDDGTVIWITVCLYCKHTMSEHYRLYGSISEVTIYV